MVLLPGCACCDCSTVCCQLAARFMAATSLEIDVSGTDYESTAITSHKALRYDELNNPILICGQGIGAQQIYFEIFKGSAYEGTYSLAFEYESLPDSNGLFYRQYAYSFNNPPYTCNARIYVFVAIQRKVTTNPFKITDSLYSITVDFSVFRVFGIAFGSVVPSLSGCTANNFCSSFFITELAVRSIQEVMCGDSFSLSDVSHSELARPIGYYRVWNESSVFGYGPPYETLDSVSPGAYDPVISFSNLRIP